LLDAKEKRANEVLAALESAKRSSTATPAPVAADAGSEKPADRAPVETASDHESHRMSNYDHDAAILHSETVANSASDSWKTSDDFKNASISVSCWNDSPDSVSSGKKRKDRSGHPKFNQLAVDYLRSWLLSRQHIEQPYPSEQNYADLSRATGLEKPQLKN
jgi:secreted trypsin-like serine protease